MPDRQKPSENKNSQILSFIGFTVLLVIPCFLLLYPIVSELELIKTHIVYQDKTQAIVKCNAEADRGACVKALTPHEKKADNSKAWFSSWILSAFMAFRIIN